MILFNGATLPEWVLPVAIAVLFILGIAIALAGEPPFAD